MHKTDYLGIHERQYKRIRAEGEPGWGGKEGEFGGFLQWLDKAFQQEDVTESGKLLELGCGDGSVTLLLAREGFEVYGIDISPTAISWAQEKAKEQGLKAEFKLGNAVENLPYSDDFLDVVVDGSCLHCIIGEDRKPFLSHTFRVLKPNGLFVVQTGCGDPAEEGPKKHFDPITRCVVIDGIAGRYLGLPEDILDEVRVAGFHIGNWEVIKNQYGQEELWAMARK